MKNKRILILESNAVVSTFYMNIMRSINSEVEIKAFENASEFRKQGASLSPSIVYLAEDFCSEILELIREIQRAYRKVEIFVLGHSKNLKSDILGAKLLYQPLFLDAFSRHLAS